MSTPVRRLRHVVAVASLALLLPALAACGFNYQTDQVYQPSVGVNNRQGTVDVLGAVVVSGVEDQGTFVASLANKDESESNTLTSVSPADESSGLTTNLAAPVEIGPGALVNLADTGAVSVSGTPVVPGSFARLTLKFESGQETEVNVPVVAQEDPYSDIEPADPSPSASPTP